MIYRALVGAGMLLGYYIFRELAKTQHIRDDLHKAREHKGEAQRLESHDKIIGKPDENQKNKETQEHEKQ